MGEVCGPQVSASNVMARVLEEYFCLCEIVGQAGERPAGSTGRPGDCSGAAGGAGCVGKLPRAGGNPGWVAFRTRFRASPPHAV